jgi:hypothetical protein
MLAPVPAARPLLPAAPAAALALALLAACGSEEEQALPGLDLAARTEVQLRERATQLRRESLEHYALLHPVEEADLLRWTAPLAVRADGDAFVLAVDVTPELHGGGVLDVLFRHWRPEGRAARPEDAYPFRGGDVALGAILAGHRLQVLLPVPGRPAEAIAGALPDPPQLPRVRFFARTPGAVPVERDAYALLRVLVARETDFATTWRNHVGQTLSVDLLMEHTWARYGGARGVEDERADHSYLHLVEVLLAYRAAARRRGAQELLDANAIKRRFLDVELARPPAGVDDEALAHYVESLGRLLADPDVDFDAGDRARVRRWLRELEEVRFADVEAVDGIFLAHLATGLRLIAAHHERLGPGTAR